MTNESKGRLPHRVLFSRLVRRADASSSTQDTSKLGGRFRNHRLDENTLRWAFYAFTIFWAAYLLLQIEPLIGKFILPWFGGSPAVWTICVLFFQVVLLAGYSYAHLSLGRLKPADQGFIHVALLLTLLMLPITPGEA